MDSGDHDRLSSTMGGSALNKRKGTSLHAVAAQGGMEGSESKLERPSRRKSEWFRWLRRFRQRVVYSLLDYQRAVVMVLLAIPFVIAVALVILGKESGSVAEVTGSVDPGAHALFQQLALGARTGSAEIPSPGEEEKRDSWFSRAWDTDRFDPVSRDVIVDQARTAVKMSGRRVEMEPENGVSGSEEDKSLTLIAACRSRSRHFIAAFESWSRCGEIDQIVIVDWSSEHDRAAEMLASVKSASKRVQEKTLLITAENQTTWSLPQAYNLAAQFSTSNWLLKVDCDTSLSSSFVDSLHTMTTREYRTAPISSDPSSGDAKLRGVFCIQRKKFIQSGGYDERLGSYGYEDVELYQRLRQNLGLRETLFPIRGIRHLSFRDLSSDQSEMLPKVLVRAHELVLNDLTPWGPTLSASMSSKYEYFEASAVTLPKIIHAVPSRKCSDAFDLIPGSRRYEILKNTTSLLMHNEFGIPWDVLSQMDDSSTREVLEIMSNNEVRPIFVDLTGSVAGRLATLMVVLATASDARTVVIASWHSDSEVIELSSLFDIPEMNRRLHQSSLNTRLFSLSRWKCKKDIAFCVKWDSVYKELTEVDFGSLRSLPRTNGKKPTLYRSQRYPTKRLASSVDKSLRRRIADAIVFAGGSCLPYPQDVGPFKDVTTLWAAIAPKEASKFVGGIQKQKGASARIGGEQGKRAYYIGGPNPMATKTIEVLLYGTEQAGVPLCRLADDASTTYVTLECARYYLCDLWRAAQPAQFWGDAGRYIRGYDSYTTVIPARDVHSFFHP